MYMYVFIYIIIYHINNNGKVQLIYYIINILEPFTDKKIFIVFSLLSLFYRKLIGVNYK